MPKAVLEMDQISHNMAIADSRITKVGTLDPSTKKMAKEPISLCPTN